MIKKINFYLLCNLILSTEFLISSAKDDRAFHQIQRCDGTITRLVQQLKPLNKGSIQDYRWTATDDLQRPERPISPHERTRRLAVGAVFSELLTSKNIHAPLKTIVSDEDALTIKEAFLDIHTHKPFYLEKGIKEGYDRTFGLGKFYEDYGNYEKSEKLSSAHHFASALWHHEEGRVMSRDPNNDLSIQEIMALSERSLDITHHEWETVKRKIDDTTDALFQKLNDH